MQPQKPLHLSRRQTERQGAIDYVSFKRKESCSMWGNGELIDSQAWNQNGHRGDNRRTDQRNWGREHTNDKKKKKKSLFSGLFSVKSTEPWWNAESRRQQRWKTLRRDARTFCIIVPHRHLNMDVDTVRCCNRAIWMKWENPPPKVKCTRNYAISGWNFAPEASRHPLNAHSLPFVLKKDFIFIHLYFQPLFPISLSAGRSLPDRCKSTNLDPAQAPPHPTLPLLLSTRNPFNVKLPSPARRCFGLRDTTGSASYRTRAGLRCSHYKPKSLAITLLIC